MGGVEIFRLWNYGQFNELKQSMKDKQDQLSQDLQILMAEIREHLHFMIMQMQVIMKTKLMKQKKKLLLNLQENSRDIESELLHMREGLHL